jgi:hypothetical protein
MEILSETLFFSILVSLFVQGLGAASNTGGILFPLKVWMEEISRSKETEKKLQSIAVYRESRRRSYQQSDWVLPAIKKLELRIMYRNMWHKPLLTCMACMSSFWGTVIFWTVFQTELHVWLLGIPVSASITVLTHKLR